MPMIVQKAQRRVWEEQRRFRRWLEMFSGRINIHFDLNAAHTNTVLLAGAARSGTTWVTDLINYDNEYRFMCEPFCYEHVWLCRHFKFLQYLSPDNDDPKFLEPARSIFSGQVRDAWIDRRNHRAIAQQRLVKHGRAGLMLGWIRRHFPGMPIVFLLRHPLAVVHSRLELGWKRSVKELVLSQDDLVQDHLLPFRSALESADGAWENQLYFWCVENYVPLKQLRSGEAHVLFYERLCVDPHAEVERLFNFLEKKISDRVFARMKVPSVQSRIGKTGDKSAILRGSSLIEGWRKHVTPDQMRRALEILALFGLDRIYGDDPMPRVGAIGSADGESAAALVSA